MALLIHSLVHGLLKTRQRTTLEVTLLIKISEAPCQYSTKNILITSSKLLESQHTESAVSGSLSSNPVFLQTWSPTQKHLPYPVSGARDTSGAAESQGSPQLSPGDPTARPCSGLSGGGPPCLHLRGEQRGKGTGSTWKGFSPVWTSWCRFSLELSTKALPHSAQTWTLGPWVCRCFLMAELSLNIFVQPFEQREKLSGSHCKLLPTIRPLNSLHLHSTTNPHPSHLNVASYHSRNN